MAASVQYRPQERDLGMVMREVDENLAIFLGIKNIDPLIEFDCNEGADPKADFDCLNLGIDKSDCEWLIAQPEISFEEQTETPNCEVTEAKNSSAAPKRRPLSSSGARKPTPRAPTPTGQRPIKSKPSRASTPTSREGPTRAPFPATAKTTSITPSNKPQTRSSTPSRAVSKPALRPSTPTRKPSITPPVKSSASSGRKTAPAISRNTVPSNGTRQITKTSLPKRPASASRGRPSAPTSSAGKPRQKSSSPVKTRAPNGNAVIKSRGYSNECDDEDSPVVMGTKMVERVVQMRKLAPPKQDGYVSTNDNAKKPSLENSGFGRSLSKTSLDMAIRHMDIRRSMHDNLRPKSTILSSKSSTSSTDSSKSSNGVKSYFLDGRH